MIRVMRREGLVTWLGCLVLAAALGCANKDTPSPEPPEDDARGPGVETNMFVSHEEEPEEVETPPLVDDGFASHYEGDFAVTSPEAVHEIADAAVAEQLNPKQTWKHSPVMPATWPTIDKKVRIYFYPMAADPRAMSRYHLFSAAWHVDVSMVDGTAEVVEIQKKKQLGVIKEQRPSMLERNELALAERALVHTVLGGDATTGENSFWGYLKYFREHPQFARDLKRKSPKFVTWVEHYKN
jgi:hypothetical protein